MAGRKCPGLWRRNGGRWGDHPVLIYHDSSHRVVFCRAFQRPVTTLDLTYGYVISTIANLVTKVACGNMFLLSICIRLAIALFTRGFFQPDEYFQALEPAHRFVFGYGHLTWEWVSPRPIRSVLYPAINIPAYWMLKVLGLDIKYPVTVVCLSSPNCNIIRTVVRYLRPGWSMDCLLH